MLKIGGEIKHKINHKLITHIATNETPRLSPAHSGKGHHVSGNDFDITGGMCGLMGSNIPNHTKVEEMSVTKSEANVFWRIETRWNKNLSVWTRNFLLPRTCKSAFPFEPQLCQRDVCCVPAAISIPSISHWGRMMWLLFVFQASGRFH